MPAAPLARRETQDLDLDATALERAREHVRAERRHHDGAAAHGARVIEQQRDDGVLEVRLRLLAKRERCERIGDDACKPGGVEYAFLEVELPAARLACTQQPFELERE